MNKTEARAIRGVIRRLRATTADASPEVVAALNTPALRRYLDTWALSALELLVMEGRTPDALKLAADLAN
jgi:hypothetical protein